MRARRRPDAPTDTLAAPTNRPRKLPPTEPSGSRSRHSTSTTERRPASARGESSRSFCANRSAQWPRFRNVAEAQANRPGFGRALPVDRASPYCGPSATEGKSPRLPPPAFRPVECVRTLPWPRGLTAAFAILSIWAARMRCDQRASHCGRPAPMARRGLLSAPPRAPTLWSRVCGLWLRAP